MLVSMKASITIGSLPCWLLTHDCAAFSERLHQLFPGFASARFVARSVRRGQSRQQEFAFACDLKVKLIARARCGKRHAHIFISDYSHKTSVASKKPQFKVQTSMLK